MSGKWHLGHSQWSQTPCGRGFQRHVGCFMWDIESFSKEMHFTPWEPLARDWVRTTFDEKSGKHAIASSLFQYDNRFSYQESARIHISRMMTFMLLRKLHGKLKTS